jgi:hypothetical protein
MTSEALKDYQSELRDGIEKFRAGRPAAQAELVREIIAAHPSLIAAPLCLAIAEALHVSREGRREAGLSTAFLELAAQALRDLSGDSDASPMVKAHGLPLALNSADALYSLGHLALLDFVGGLEGREGAAAARLDTLCASAWEGCAGPGADAPTFNDWSRVLGAVGRFAGVAAGLAAGRSQAAVEALGEFAAGAASGSAGAASEALRTGVFSEDEHARLQALLR